MNTRTGKLNAARQKLKKHQEKMKMSKDKPPELTNQIPPELTNQISGGTVPGMNTLTTIFTQNQEDFTELNPYSSTTVPSFHNDDVDVNEILISTEQSQEPQVDEMQSKLSTLENNHRVFVSNNSNCKQQILHLEHKIGSVKERLVKSTEDNKNKEIVNAEVNNVKLINIDEEKNLQEQLKFTQSVLSAKETENNMLRNQINSLQIDLESTQLQLQQISSGLEHSLAAEQELIYSDKNPEVLIQKIYNLEQQLKSSQNEMEQLNFHYKHYLSELNNQLKETAKRNHDLEEHVQRLSTREIDFIEKINDMENIIQNLRLKPLDDADHDRAEGAELFKDDTELNELRDKCTNLQNQLEILSKRFEKPQINYGESKANVQTQSQQTEEKYFQHDGISVSKLTADMASYKVAAQKATEQNKKLKKDLQELEEAFVKISKDKLELIEKITAEKYLNRELTVKLAEVQEGAKDLYTKLHSKDVEMIRLQNSLRELENKISESKVQTHETSPSVYSDSAEHTNCDEHDHTYALEEHETNPAMIENTNENQEHHCFLNQKVNDNDSSLMLKKDAMVKLQDRFLKIMDEVANLSDEKHRLEHIILQLQFETETICEYVALYQQQRSLLKKRDEERCAQIKKIQSECSRLKRQLVELNDIITRLAKDIELGAFFQSEPRQSDIAKVMILLSDLLSNTLINSYNSSSGLISCYPCNCCSGPVIEV